MINLKFQAPWRKACAHWPGLWSLYSLVAYSDESFCDLVVSADQHQPHDKIVALHPAALESLNQRTPPTKTDHHAPDHISPACYLDLLGASSPTLRQLSTGCLLNIPSIVQTPMQLQCLGPESLPPLFKL